MTPQKFVVRLLDDAGELLGWAEVQASPKPQERGASCPFWPTGRTLIEAERSGTATRIAVHWCDLDVARVEALVESVELTAGLVYEFAWIQPVWLVPGMRGVPLPGVTVRGATIAPATGMIYGRGIGA